MLQAQLVYVHRVLETFLIHASQDYAFEHDFLVGIVYQSSNVFEEPIIARRGLDGTSREYHAQAGGVVDGIDFVHVGRVVSQVHVGQLRWDGMAGTEQFVNSFPSQVSFQCRVHLQICQTPNRTDPSS